MRVAPCWGAPRTRPYGLLLVCGAGRGDLYLFWSRSGLIQFLKSRLTKRSHFHASFERIHPFRDGNGRVGRLILNLLLVRHGVPPAILYQRDRAKYLRALRRADEGENGPLGEVVARSVRHSIERHVLPALAGPLRLVPLGSLATADVSRLALLSAERRNRLRAVRMSDAYCSTRQWGEEYKSSR